MATTTRIILDTRYQKENSSTYPVRLRIIHDRRQRLFSTGKNLTEAEFKRMMGGRPGELKKTKIELDDIEKKAIKIIEDIKKRKPFTFDEFKRKMYSTSTKGTLAAAFDEYIQHLQADEKIGTAISYTNAKTSLLRFNPGIILTEISPDFLKQYEKWMKKQDNSLTTVGMYLRCLRAIINRAISDGSLSPEYYPFAKENDQDKSKYKIKKSGRRNIALHIDEVAKIFAYKPEKGSTTEKAKDFFIFMYLGNGINVKDVCLLKYKNIEGGFLMYNRQKTEDTKVDQKEIRIHLKPQMMQVIKKWGNDPEPENYIFPILSPGLTAQQIHAKKRDFNCLLNKHLKIIAEKTGIKKNLTTYVARHSFATVLKRSGASIELISELLNHSDLKITQGYMAGFEDETIINATDALTAFDPPQQAKIVNL